MPVSFLETHFSVDRRPGCLCRQKDKTAASQDLKIPCRRRTDQFPGTRGMTGMPRKGHPKPHTRTHSTCTVSMQSRDRCADWVLDSQRSRRETEWLFWEVSLAAKSRRLRQVDDVSVHPCKTWQKTTSERCHRGISADISLRLSLCFLKFFIFHNVRKKLKVSAHWTLIPIGSKKVFPSHFLSTINLGSLIQCNNFHVSVNDYLILHLTSI